LGETGVVMARVPSFVETGVTSSAKDVERLPQKYKISKASKHYLPSAMKTSCTCCNQLITP